MKSNLGMYQYIVTASKKVRGPLQFLTCVAFIGYGLGRAIEFGATKAYAYTKGHMAKKNDPHVISTATVRVAAETDGGVKLNAGDVVQILAQDGNAIFISVPGFSGNPYCVSADWLRAISNYEPKANPKTA